MLSPDEPSPLNKSPPNIPKVLTILWKFVPYSLSFFGVMTSGSPGIGFGEVVNAVTAKPLSFEIELTISCANTELHEILDSFGHQFREHLNLKEPRLLSAIYRHL